MRVVLRPASGSVKPKAHWSSPGDQPRHPARLLLRRALHDDRMRPEQVDVHGRGGGHAAAVACDLMHHDGGFGDAEARAAVFLRHGDAEPAGLRHRAMELARKDAVVVARQPVIVAELRDDGAHAFADRVAFVFSRQGPALRSCRLFLFVQIDASVFCAAFRCGMSTILPSMPSVPDARDWRRTPRRCGARGRSPASEGV